MKIEDFVLTAVKTSNVKMVKLLGLYTQDETNSWRNFHTEDITYFVPDVNPKP